MYSVEQDFRLRMSEAKGLIELIKNIENGNVSAPIPINLPVLRSSVIMNLYNIIESTITQTLTRIHDEINTNDVIYDDLSRSMKDLALIYFYKHQEKRADIHASIDLLHHTIDLVRGTGTFNVPYLDMMESYQLYSGNLDARSIRKIMGKYGTEISDSCGQKLKAIKNGRNTLSHGNKSFEEFGRELVIPMLEGYWDDVEDFLNEVILAGSRFIDEKLYLQVNTA